ncbi:Sesquipedalian-1 [Sciurus carolinensis]|uniref:Sesquipedalian n=1 Tax=Sciurus carolinensis TaxID=30640 RepID=A0AA41NJP6_SCICA|nr:Sesquipedalian-1 [Sciurus carolinensis]
MGSSALAGRVLCTQQALHARGHGPGTRYAAPAAGMKLNERSLAFYATCDAPVDNAGFLYKKGGRHAAYHRRWFVLRGNMLFYFEEPGSREPVGVIILEGCTVELVEAAEEFAFAVRFAGARARTYVLAAESQAAMEGWVKALSRASFDYLRLVVRELEQQLAAMRAAGGAAPPRRPSALPPRENGCACARSLQSVAGDSPVETSAAADTQAHCVTQPRPHCGLGTLTEAPELGFVAVGGLVPALCQVLI